MLRLIVVLCSLIVLPATAMDHPETRRANTVDVYHGVKVSDPYQWLEDWSSQEVKSWSAAQNSVARKALDQLPGRAAIAKDVEAVVVADTLSYYSGERVGDQAWFIKYAPPKQQPFLVQVNAVVDDRAERIIFDPAEGDASASTSIEWFDVSPDGKLVAIALTVAGAEVADLHLFDLNSGDPIDTVLPRVNGPTAGGEMSWDADSKGFFYTRYPRDGETSPQDQNFFQQLWHRKLGTPLEDDRYELGRKFDRIAEIRVQQHHASGKVLATMQYGDSGKFQLYVRDKKQTWLRVSNYEDKIVQAQFIDGATLLALSRAKAPRGKFVALDISKLPSTSQSVLVDESEETLASDFYGSPTFIVHNDLIYAKVLLGGPENLRVFNLQGKSQRAPKLGVSGIGQIIGWGDDVLIRHSSYFDPNSWLTFDGTSARKHELSSTSAVNFDDYKVVRELATSKDGTKVPVNIIMAKKTKLDGNNPLLLTGYGGYGISLSPGFSPVRKIWLDQGGIISIANLRGGGEFGETWHQQGMLTAKQNVFDDFHAVMGHLVTRGYTQAKKLVIEGGSNGGLLMGAMITQHPKDFAATVSHVGIYDSLRTELSPNGAFNIPEFGTVTNEAHFKALHAYSPYHNVAKDDYPAVLFMTGENDGRVDPMHSRKMTAVLQSASSSKNPIWLRTSGSTGHGSGTPLDEGIAQAVDRFAFMFDSLGIEYVSP